VQITITVGPDGKIELNCSEDRPWLAVKALRAVADAIAEGQAQKESAAAPAVLGADGLPPGLVSRLNGHR
jgi:CTP:molybdopterin cytidylyltransferase MocA